MYDVVQFTKDDWRNRNQIRTASGLQWLTVPVRTAGRFGQTIAETEVAGDGWAGSHWKTITQAYARAPFFPLYREAFESAFASCASETRLSVINARLIRLVATTLGLPTRIVDADVYRPQGDRNERLVSLCRSAGATVYLSGPSARRYLDVAMFTEAGVDVAFMDYSRYAPYPQVHGGFEPQVSVLDLLFNTGPSVPAHVLRGAPWARPAGDEEQ